MNGNTKTGSIHFTATFNQEGNYTVQIKTGSSSFKRHVTAVYNAHINTNPSPPVYNQTVSINGTLTNATGHPVVGKQLRLRDPSGAIRANVTTANGGVFNFTASVANDAANWRITGNSLTYKQIRVRPQTASVSLKTSGPNLGHFNHTYSLQVNATNGNPINTGSTNINGYVNVTGPFAAANYATQAAVLSQGNTSSNTETAYLHVKTNANGAATFYATPVGQSVKAALENGPYGGLEVTNDAASTPSFPDYVGNTTLSTQGAKNVNVNGFAIQDPANKSITNSEYGGPYLNSTGKLSVLPVQNPNSSRVVNGHRLGNDTYQSFGNITVYRVAFGLRNKSNIPIEPNGTGHGNLSSITFTGAGVNGSASYNASASGNLSVSGPNVVNATYNKTSQQYHVLVRPTKVTTQGENFTVGINVQGFQTVHKTVPASGLYASQFLLNGNKTSTIPPDSVVNVTAVLKDANAGNVPVNNGRVRVTQSGTTLNNSSVDGRTAYINNGQYTFNNVHVGPRGIDTNGNGIGNKVSKLTFTGYKYTDANNNQALQQNEVSKATVQTVGLSKKHDLNVTYLPNMSSTYSGRSNGTFTLTRGVEYNQIAFNLTNGQGQPVNLTNGINGTHVPLNKLTKNGLVSLGSNGQSLNVTFNASASDPANGTYVIGDIQNNASAHVSSPAGNQSSDSFVFNTSGLNARPQSFQLHIETPKRSQVVNNRSGQFQVKNAQVSTNVVSAAGPNINNVTWGDLNHNQTDSFKSSNVSTLTIGVNRTYRVNATARDALGTRLNGSAIKHVNVTAGLASPTDSAKIAMVNGPGVSPNGNATTVTNANGSFQFDIQPTNGGSNGQLKPAFNVTAKQSKLTSLPQGHTLITGKPIAKNPVVNVYDQSGAKLPTSKQSGNQILAKQPVTNQLRVEAFPADPNGYALPNGLVYKIAGPTAENSIKTTTTLSNSTVTPGFSSGQIGYFAVTPTGTGTGLLQLQNGQNVTVQDESGSTIVFDVLQSNLQVSTSAPSTTTPGSNVSVKLTQKSTGKPLPKKVKVNLVNPNGNKVVSALTNSHGVANLSVPANAVTGTYTITTRPAGYSPTSVDLQVSKAASVAFNNQTVTSGAKNVTVRSAYLPQGGFVVIHNATQLHNGSAIKSIRGHSGYLSPGTHQNVTITLSQPITGNESLIAMDHRDTNGNYVDNFASSNGSVDTPYMANGSPVVDSAQITAKKPTNLSTSYRVSNTTVSPGSYVTVAATVTNTGGMSGMENVSFYADGHLFTTKPVTVAAGANQTVTASVQFRSAGMHNVSVNGQPATQITVQTQSQAPVVVGNTPAKTYKNSSKYLDVNGDGKLNIVDVQAFFAHRNQIAKMNSSVRSKFDFNGNGKIDIGDVQKLFHKSQTSS